ncbi:MAG: hypothetical protein PHD70_03020 [Anaerostipes sp.]|nr:hypothetical protein [Anaerostipes sp.]
MKNLNKSMILLFILLLSLTLNPSTYMIYASDTLSTSDIIIEESDTDITLYSTKIVWRYKAINGKIYKRKYDTSKKKWIGKWIPA